MMTSTDVLVVGAGPTGLTAAVELARRGIAIRVVDKHSGRARHSNALIMHARTLEVMDLIGLSDELLGLGYAAPGIDLGSDSERPVRAEMRDLDTRFPYILVVPQSETERVLETHLNGLGVEVERSKEFVGYERLAGAREEGVESRLHLPGGEEETVRSRFLLGTDGARSKAREAAGIEFEGEPYGYTFFTAEAKVDGGIERGGVSQYSSDRGLAFVVPFRDDYFRFVTVDYAHWGEPTDRELTLQEMQESVDAIVPAKPTLLDPRWMTRWGSEIRRVSTYRKGRVFLAGDSAHVHSPAGGQGMNTGIQDAFNLGWKLAFVLRGWSPESLLDSYEAERLPLGHRAVRISDLILRSLLIRNPKLRAARELLARTLVPLPPIQRALSEGLSGIGVDYRRTERESGNLAEDLRQDLGADALRAGDRVPDLELNVPEDPAKELPPGPTARLHELLRGPSYSLFVYASSGHTGGDSSKDLARFARSVGEATGGAVRTRAVVARGAPGWAGPEVPVLADSKHQFEGRIGARDDSALLVRPDGYVAFHRRRHGRTLSAALGRWVQRNPSPSRSPALRSPQKQFTR